MLGGGFFLFLKLFGKMKTQYKNNIGFIFHKNINLDKLAYTNIQAVNILEQAPGKLL